MRAEKLRVIANPDGAIAEIGFCHVTIPALAAAGENVDCPALTVQGDSPQRHRASEPLARPYRTCLIKAGIQCAAATTSLIAAVSSVVCAFATIAPVKPSGRDQVASSMSSLRET